MLRFVVAAGWIKSPEEAEKYRGCADELVLGSFTPMPRLGNTGANFHHDADYSTVLNSIGLKNQGLEAALEQFKGKFDLTGPNDMFRVSIAAFSVSEYASLVKMLVDAGVRRIGFNVGCPNTSALDRILAFDPPALETALSVASKFWDGKRRPYIAVKPSPYSDPHMLKDVAQIFNESGCVNEVVASNTFPNARAYDADGKSRIEVADGYAGLSGKGMKAIALGQVAQFRKHLRSDIAVAGAGGVHSGVDAHDFELAGASSVHIGSLAFLEGPRAVSRLMQEYAELK